VLFLPFPVGWAGQKRPYGLTIIRKKSSGKGESKTYYSIAWGSALGQRMSTGIFIYSKPKDHLQNNHNKEALAILDNKKSQMILDQQAIAAGYIPRHFYKSNFLD